MTTNTVPFTYALFNLYPVWIKSALSLWLIIWIYVQYNIWSTTLLSIIHYWLKYQFFYFGLIVLLWLPYTVNTVSQFFIKRKHKYKMQMHFISNIVLINVILNTIKLLKCLYKLAHYYTDPEQGTHTHTYSEPQWDRPFVHSSFSHPFYLSPTIWWVLLHGHTNLSLN